MYNAYKGMDSILKIKINAFQSWHALYYVVMDMTIDQTIYTYANKYYYFYNMSF